MLPHSIGRQKVRKERKLIEFEVGLPLNISIDWNITQAVASQNHGPISGLPQTVLTSGEAPDVDASL
jgi:hypothetical protein